MSEKQKQRSLMKDLSQNFRVNNLKLWEQKQTQLQSHLIEFLKQEPSGTWCLYKALPSEISLNQIPEKLAHLRWVYPKVDGSRLRFFVPGPKGFEPGFAKIEEPVILGAEEVDVSAIQGVLVPGLGFDERGNRLGQGKGFYDRMLANYHGTKVGVTFREFVVKELPTEEHDVRMNVLATDEGIKRVWK